MNITEEGNQAPKKEDDLPLGTPFDTQAKKMISASKVKKKVKTTRLQYQDLEKKQTWDDVFKDCVDEGGFDLEFFMDHLVEKYNPPTRKS